MSKFKTNNRGFSILESMVAITILLIAVVGPLSTIGNSLAQIYIARDQMVAINLAQEGIEAVRQIRDSNMITGWNGETKDWFEGIYTDTPRNFYTLDVYANNPSVVECTACTDSTGSVIKIDSEGREVMVGGTDTKFSRVIHVVHVSTNEVSITSKVYWTTSGGTPKDITVTESLFGINTP